MRAKKTYRWYDCPSVVLRPDDPNGQFAVNVKGERKVSSEIRVTGMKPDHILAMELGDIAVLGNYVKADPEQPHTYNLVNCVGQLVLDNGNFLLGISSVTEIAPQPLPASA
jgi:hypothetical protein